MVYKHPTKYKLIRDSEKGTIYSYVTTWMEWSMVYWKLENILNWTLVELFISKVVGYM